MAFRQTYPIRAAWLPAPSRRRPGAALTPGVRFIVAHDTGNPRSTADQNVRYYSRTANEQSASAHLFVDDSEIVECIPALTSEPEKAWHVRYAVAADDQLFGHDANDAAIGVEYCYGGAIDADEAYRRYVWTLACVCDRFVLDPARQIVGHCFLDPGRKTDPMTGLAASRRSYEQLLRDVADELRVCRGGTLTDPVEVPVAGTATAHVRLNLRQGTPSTRAPISRTVPAGSSLPFVATTVAGEPVNGNALWYRTIAGEWFWGGGVGVDAHGP